MHEYTRAGGVEGVPKPRHRTARRRRGALAMAVALVAMVLVVAGPADGATPMTRAAGVNRFATAVDLSATRFPGGAEVAYVATGMQFPDALAGGAAASAEGAPVLLVERDALPKVTSDELNRLGVSRVVVLGGTSAVSEQVVAAIGSSTGATVQRRAGIDRYGTAAAVAEVFAPGVPAVFVAAGEGFTDAMAGAPGAAAEGAPVLLVQANAVPQATADQLQRLSPGRIVVVGPAVSAAVEQQLGAFADSVVRVSGGDPSAVSVNVSKQGFPAGAPTAFLATSYDFPDALAGGAAAGAAGGPVLLVPGACMPAGVKAELDRLQPAETVVLGGTAAVGVGVESVTPCAASPDAAGIVPCQQVSRATPLHRFYMSCTAHGGVLVASSGLVPPAAVIEAARVVSAMTAKRADVRQVFRDQGFFVGIMAATELTTDIPEYRHLKDDPDFDWDGETRGLGGLPTTAGEENVLCYESDSYRGESILVHEFAHGFLELGIAKTTGGAAFVDRVEAAYQAAMAAGRWENTYAATNHHEFWAEGVQSWFGTNFEADPPNGIHNHVNTRAELQAYEPELAALVGEVMPADWTYSCP